MGLEISVGPPVLTINRGRTVMVTNRTGEIDQTDQHGVFMDDTRFLSTYTMHINERPWELVTSATVTYYAERIDLVNPPVILPDGRTTIPGRTLALTVNRVVTEGITENFAISNFSLARAQFNFEIVLRSDFADLFEVKENRVVRRGSMSTYWNDDRQELVTLYRNGDFARSCHYYVLHAPEPASYANGRLIFEIVLEPGESWQADTHIGLDEGSEVQSPHALRSRYRRVQAHEFGPANLPKDEPAEAWRATCTRVDTPNDHVYRAYDQAVQDMGALRLPDTDKHENTFVPAAGVPWFMALFGRDSLIVSLQTMMVHAPFAIASLEELGRYQATERDDWRDAQPGKILHELRRGELAHFHLIPHTPYYGTADATILYLIVLHEAYMWTGDLKLVKQMLPVAERCLEWIDKYGDLDGDGFQEYKTFSNLGYENQGWKDAHDAVVYPDGSQVPQPKALCELQGYVFDAKCRMADLYTALDDHEKAKRMRREAEALREAFDRAFWLESEGIYAYTLDPNKRPVATVSSNMGHLLWSGIALPERAESVVSHLLADDMWSGWGIRTLSAKNPAFNPYSYQNGSVWPHDNGIIAAGFKRYGFDQEANKVARAIFDAARCFSSYRLPEVYSGMTRVPDSFPAQYLGANIPQAWAAGSVFQILQSMLGLRADAPNRRLYVNPSLPPWLPELRVPNLGVGGTRLYLRFHRRRDGSSAYDVLGQEGKPIDVRHAVPAEAHR